MEAIHGQLSILLLVYDSGETDGKICQGYKKFILANLTTRTDDTLQGNRQFRYKNPLLRIQAWTFYDALTQSPLFRERIWNYFSYLQVQCLRIKLVIDQTPLVWDRRWSLRVTCLVNNRMEVEELMALLSTLGGAFSCIGEIDTQAARIAGKIAQRQLSLSKSTGDPNLVVRCFLYQVYSLCQQGFKKKAIRVMKYLIYPFICRLIHEHSCEDIIVKMYRAARQRILFLNDFETRLK